MDIQLNFVSTLPDKAAFQNLMVAYFETVLERFASIGGPRLSPVSVAAQTTASMVDYLPPNGRILLAQTADGQLMGCGVLRKIRPDAAELKRMFVRPEARGRGLGRKIFEMRIAEAQKMGCREVFADTFKGNTAMLSMYEKLGFSYIPRYAENANPESFEPYLVYLKYRFEDA